MTLQHELQQQEKDMTRNKTDGEFDSDVGYPYHLQPDIIKMALFIHNAKDDTEKMERVEFGLSKFDYKFMAHVMAMLMLPYLMEQGMKSDDYKNFMEQKKKRFN